MFEFSLKEMMIGALKVVVIAGVITLLLTLI
jgi:hypothetical protein